ncbi:MAG TPA: hypothetical protein VEH29_16145 [Acidimicrobiales bacterium]|nr:hypothetical protein [Acidimicrobiales bacterium]
MSQNDGVVVRLRNTGRTACLLRGTPRVVASAPGQATVFATTAPMWPLGEIANTAPGGIVAVIINVPVACPADPGGGNIGLPVYHRLRISIPGGGNKKIGSLHLMFQCGMSTTPFFTPKPQPTYPPDPLVALIPHLQLPASVRAGTTLLYQVELVNPESRPVALSPCPVYLEWSDFPTKLAYRLNCRNTHPIAAHGQVRYQMEIAIPVSAPLGPAQVWWSLFGPSTHIGRGQVQVR